MYSTHPFIVGLKYSFQTPQKLCLVLDYAAGGSMALALKLEQRFKELRAKMYIAEIVLAIEDLHSRGVVYRDLKPDNVVFDSEGHALLTDFGLAKQDLNLDDLTKTYCGSPAYMAPEMLRRSGHGLAIDWYQVGVLLYEMLIGIPPYMARDEKQLYYNILKGPLRMPLFLNKHTKDFIIQLLNRNPDTRLGSGPNGSQNVKNHRYFAAIDWKQVEERRLPVPKPFITQTKEMNVRLQRVYGKHYDNETLQNDSRLDRWSMVKRKK